jgi:hypothetical protein
MTFGYRRRQLLASLQNNDPFRMANTLAIPPPRNAGSKDRHRGGNENYDIEPALNAELQALKRKCRAHPGLR